MALKKLKLKLEQAPPTKGDMPTLQIEGDSIAQYVAADRQMKDAEDVMKDLRPEILEAGLDKIFELNCQDPLTPVPTIKVTDDKNAVVRVQFTKKYSVVTDVDRAEDLFDSLTDPDGKEVDINAYVQEVVQVKFENAVFYDVDGKFKPEIYEAFEKAIGRCARKLGVASPIASKKAVLPLESFHLKRFAVFPEVEVQKQLSLAMPNTVQIVPVVPKTEKESVKA